MAENKKLTNTSSVDTSLFNKGMIKDMNASFSGKENWTHARNAANNSSDGDVGVLGNEPANLHCIDICYTLIGTIHLYGDKWVLFSTDNTSSEIGLFDDSQCKYEVIVNDPCLAFNKRYIITGASKENFDCTWQVYWDDSINPSRTLNIDNVPWIQQEISDPSNDCKEYYDTTNLNCEKIRLAPLVDTPCIVLDKAPDGGQLKNGSYQIFIAYTINEQKIGDYIGISNVQSLFAHLGLGGALTINVSNLDKDFDYYEVVILSNIFQQAQAQRLGLYSTEQTTIHIDNIDNSLSIIPFDLLPLRNPAYEKSDKMYVVNDWLIRSGPTEQFDFNYQPQANVIRAHWASTQYPAEYYYDGGHNPTFLRDEVYSFFIRFIYNTGERSSSYHIPGRAPSTFTLQDGTIVDELAPGPGVNLVDTTDRMFEVYNTATVDTLVPSLLDDGGIVLSKGNMAYWESTERYPAKEPDIWGDLCGKPIRHHKMPYEGTARTVALTDDSAVSIRLLGVEFSNISPPVDNEGKIITNIIGYELLRGTREGNRSIIGKGIIKNMRKYDLPKGDQTDINSLTGAEETKQALYPNYPYNDLYYDTYLSELETDGCEKLGLTNSLVTYPPLGTEDQSPIPGSNVPNPFAEQGKDGQYEKGYKKDIFTFHSPELMFRRPYLNPSEVRIYGEVWGKSSGNFIPSEKHPQNKLLRNGAALVAIIFGVGYALQKMRGRRDNIDKIVQGLNVGVSGGGTGIAPLNVFAMGAGTLHNFHIKGSSKPNITAPLQTPPAWPPLYFAAGTLGQALTDLLADMLIGSATTIGDMKFGGTIAPEYWQGKIGKQNLVNAAAMGGFTGGGGQEWQTIGSAFRDTPDIFKFIMGGVNFMTFTAEGGQQIIDIIYNLFSYQDYAYKYNSHGFYKNFSTAEDSQRFRSGVDFSSYLNNTLQGFGKNYKVNNLQRPATVGVEITNWFKNPKHTDYSRIVIGDEWSPRDPDENVPNKSPDLYAHQHPDKMRRRTISSWYAAMKVSFQNQYGQLDGIKQLPMRGCINLFPTDHNIIPEDLFTSEVIFGGDNYVGRYTEKTIMPFFWEFLKDNEDGFPFDYTKYQNIQHPRYWMNTEKYRLSLIAQQIVNLNTNFDDFLPNDLFYLDRRTGDCGSGKSGLKAIKANAASQDGNVDSDSDGSLSPSQKDKQFKNSGMFGIKYAYMYTHCNGINDFYVESEVNLAQRDWGESPQEYVYDEYYNTEYAEMFNSDIIKLGNFYKYDWSLSVSKFLTNLVSFGNIQPRDYDPKIAETCFTYYPKRLIYSLQAQKEAKKDFWRVFLPNNYKDFKSQVNVIKPISKSGALIFFPYISPQLFQGLDQLQTDAGVKITIGDGGLFSQPFQNVVNADVSNEYASCESARSVINTPSGLFFLSQAQGKVFQYTGQLANISNQGMKWWFNKYLPSELLAQFPELEGNVDVDNPVAGIGCQSIYDPNDDIVYFCKKDYAVVDEFKDLLVYDPGIGFGYNETVGSNMPQVPYCPIGLWNPTTGKCEYTTYSAPTEIISGSSTGAGITGGAGWQDEDDCFVDIAIVYNCLHDSILPYTQNTFPTILRILQSLQPEMAAGKVRVALVKYSSTSAIPQNNSDTSPPWQSVTHLTNDYAKLVSCVNLWLGAAQTVSSTPKNACNNQRVTNYADALHLAYEQLTDTTILNTASAKKFIFLTMEGVDKRDSQSPAVIPASTDGKIPELIWPGSPIMNNDTKLMQNCGSSAGTYIYPVASILPGGVSTLSPAQLYAIKVKDQIVLSGGEMFVLSTDAADLTDTGTLGLPLIPTSDGGYQNYLKHCAQFGGGTQGDFGNWIFGIGSDFPSGADNYFGILSSNPVGGYLGLENNEYDAPLGWTDGFIQAVKTAILTCESEGGGTVVPGTSPDITYICPTDCELTTNNANQPICECLHQSEPIMIDDVTPIVGGLTNEIYFKEISWTVSYDPKAKAWISFHDWYPELTLPSINHFLSSKSFPLSEEEEPCCPPGYTLKRADGPPECCKTIEIPPLQIPQVITSNAIPNGTEVDVEDASAPGTFGSRSALLYDPGYTIYAGPGSFSGQAITYTDSTPSWIAVSGGPTGLAPTTPGTYGVQRLIADFWIDPPPLPGTWNGIVNKLAKWAPGALDDVWYGFTAPIQVPATRTYFIVLAADNQFRFSLNGQIIIESSPETPVPCGGASDAVWTEHAWQVFQVMGYPNARYTCGNGIEVAYRSAHIYPIELTEGCHEITMEGLDFSGLGMFGCAILNKAGGITANDIVAAQSFADLPCLTEGHADYIFSSEFAKGMYTDSTGWICEDPTIPISYGPDGCTPICKKITYELGCPEGCKEHWIYYTGNDGETTGRRELICLCEDCTEPSYEKGTLWRHNDRCDLFANYYDIDYPWEVEFVETTGQVVNTVRSLEYQLECFVYKGNLENGCGDRWHDLDFNFDESIIYNTEQVSGLLRLHQIKNDPVAALQYPINPGTGGLDILYNKVEQKYRFNMFWDLTRDRGEFIQPGQPNVEQNIWITQLNGYIKDLNNTNLDYQKPLRQRKKFRHYYNKAILRRRMSGNRKMLLKLVNTKLNISFR